MRLFPWILAALVTAPLPASAEPAACKKVDRATLPSCVRSGSPALKGGKAAVEAAELRKQGASAVLPSNPVVSVLVASRQGTRNNETDINWYVSLSQEIEIAGQSGARRRAAQAERDAAELGTVRSEQELLAAAWTAYFELLAAREVVKYVKDAEAAAALAAKGAAAGAAQGVGAGLEADAADAALLVLSQERIAAEKRIKDWNTRLAGIVGADPAVALTVDGELEPLAEAELALGAAKPAAERPEPRALEAEARAFDAKADAIARSRVPNLTLSVFVQNDGFGERVVGGGIGIPLPMPSPVGRTPTAEVGEARALARKARADADSARQDVKTDLALAKAGFESAKKERALHTADRIERARKGLAALGGQVESQRLAWKDAIPLQQALLGLLKGEVEARRKLCLSSVELARAAGLLVRGSKP